MHQYKENLIKKYNDLEITTADDIFECTSSQYVSLLLVKIDGKGKKEYNISGELHEILRPVACSEDHSQDIQPSLHDVLDVRDEKNKMILIEGGPGMGKSTLAIKMCQCWGTGGLLTSYDVLILLTLRDPEIQKSKSLHEILSTTNDNERLVDKILHILEGNEENKFNVCFLLEGYDELPASLQSNRNCIFNKLFEMLPKCTFIYTSCPSACEKLRSLASRRIMIQGFEEKHIYKYAENAFQKISEGKKKSADLTSKLKNNPTLNDLMKIPINLAIACHIFSVELNLPDTLTELYNILCLQIVLWHIRKRTPNKDNITALCDLNHMPAEISEQFAQVCLIAYKGTVDDILVFSTKYL